MNQRPDGEPGLAGKNQNPGRFRNPGELESRPLSEG